MEAEDHLYEIYKEALKIEKIKNSKINCKKSEQELECLKLLTKSLLKKLYVENELENDNIFSNELKKIYIEHLYNICKFQLERYQSNAISKTEVNRLYAKSKLSNHEIIDLDEKIQIVLRSDFYYQCWNMMCSLDKNYKNSDSFDEQRIYNEETQTANNYKKYSLQLNKIRNILSKRNKNFDEEINNTIKQKLTSKLNNTKTF